MVNALMIDDRGPMIDDQRLMINDF